MKKECLRIAKNLRKSVEDLKILNNNPQFGKATHVLLTDSSHEIDLNIRIGEIEGTIYDLEKINELKTGLDITKMKNREKEDIFAWLMIIFQAITGNDPEKEIVFSSSNNWKGTGFYKFMEKIFKTFEISIPSEMTTRGYLERFPFNDNDKGGFIQSCYESYFGEHTKKKKYLNSQKQK